MLSDDLLKTGGLLEEVKATLEELAEKYRTNVPILIATYQLALLGPEILGTHKEADKYFSQLLCLVHILPPLQKPYVHGPGALFCRNLPSDYVLKPAPGEIAPKCEFYLLSDRAFTSIKNNEPKGILVCQQLHSGEYKFATLENLEIGNKIKLEAYCSDLSSCSLSKLVSLPDFIYELNKKELVEHCRKALSSKIYDYENLVIEIRKRLNPIMQEASSSVFDLIKGAFEQELEQVLNMFKPREAPKDLYR